MQDLKMYEPKHSFGAALGLIKAFKKDFTEGSKKMELLIQNNRHDVLKEVNNILNTENKTILGKMNALYVNAQADFPNHSPKSVEAAIAKCWRNRHSHTQETYSGHGLEDAPSLKILERYAEEIDPLCSQIVINKKILETIVNKLTEISLEKAIQQEQDSICTLV